MEQEDVSQNKNISGLSFRDLDITKDSFDSTSSESFLFVNDNIEEGKTLKRIKRKFHTFYVVQASRNNFFEFVLALLEYSYKRIKVIIVLLSVLFDIIFESFNNLKNTFTRKMFWGRGNFLGSALKILSISIVFILSISYLYRKPVVTIASDTQLETVGVAETDLMVTNSTVNTLVPKDRARRSTEKYIVKGGDTLSTIAEYYEISTESILWANDMSSSSVIKPGDTLLVPPSDGVLVTVKSGDTIYTLAKKYEASDQAIADFNWLDYPFDLTIGQELFIPDGIEPTPVVVKPVYASTPSYISNQYKGATSASAAVDPNVGKFLSWPVAGGAGVISQYFKGTYHLGIDIASKALPNIVAAAGGTVIFAGCNGSCPSLGSTYGGSGYAWSIQIDHGNGYSTWYAHLKNIYVRSGQVVSKGEVIGQMGSTGRSTGPHVHFELRRGTAYGTEVNPISYASW